MGRDKKNALKRVYISGPISGRKFMNVYQDFSRAEKALKDRGYEVINPLNNGVHFLAPHCEHMRVDLGNECRCQGIYYIKHWRRWVSKGVWIERIVAKAIGMKVLGEKDVF